MTAILGGGIAGLTAAFEALRHPRLNPIVLFEASNRLGGWIESKQMPDGTIFEQGPRLFQTNSNHMGIYSVLDSLDLAKKVNPILNRSPVSMNRLIYKDNQLHNLNSIALDSLSYVFKTKPPFERPLGTILFNILRSPKALKDDENIYTFFETRFGRDIAQIVETVVCGIFAGDAQKLSIRSVHALNKLFEQEYKAGSMFRLCKKVIRDNLRKTKTNVPKPKPKIDTSNSPTTLKALDENWYGFTLTGGTEELAKAMIENIRANGVETKTNHYCKAVSFKPDHVELMFNDRVESFDRIISALPAKKLAQLIEKEHSDLANELYAIPTVTVGIVNLQYSGEVLPMEAFGLLVSPRENLPILGITFDSCFITPHDKSTTVLTVLMGGVWFEKYFGVNASKDHLLNVAIEQVNNILHVNQDPMACSVNILENCIPQYYVGHRKRLTRIQNYLSQHKIPLELCGSSYHGIGVIDTILSAREAVSFKTSKTTV